MLTKLLPCLLVLSLVLAGCAPALPAQTPASAAQPGTSPLSGGAAIEPAPAEAQSVPPVAQPATPVVSTGSGTPQAAPSGLAYPLVDTGQSQCYDLNRAVACPSIGSALFGQDAQYTGNVARYQDNGDGTVTDLVTGLMWQQDPGVKLTYTQAVAGADALNLAGYSDWRLPNIKELYSLILFDGTDVSNCNQGCEATPFIDTRYFKFAYGDTSSGDRIIDAQFASSTKYVSTTMNGEETVFGVNFADGRIKGYGLMPRGQAKTFFILYVRGNPGYGQNSFVDLGNGTISDQATGLTWTQADSGAGMDWEAALNYCENLELDGSDWRLPDAKELQSLLDYSRSPATSNSPAIDPLFATSSMLAENGRSDYGFYWSSTTHANVTGIGTIAAGNGTYAAYIAFGSALGYMGSSWVDVHGAGAQRSDPKTGSAADFPQGHGPQGDAVRVDNYVRCVRGGSVTATPAGSPSTPRPTISIAATGGAPTQGGQPGAGGAPGQSGPGGQPPAGGMPPQAAIDACTNLSLGAACQFTAPRGSISGTCQTVQQQLACVPAGGPQSNLAPAGPPATTATASQPSGAAALSPALIANPILGRPTDTTITLNLVPAAAITVYYEYGPAPDDYSLRSAPQSAAAGVALETLLSGLQPDTHYSYRLRYSLAGSDFAAGEVHSFVTQRAPGSSFTFAIQGDSHPERVRNEFDAALYTKTLTSAAAAQPDFYIAMGDDFSVDTLKTLNAESVAALYIAQRQWLGLVEAPVFLVNGNHEQAAANRLDGTPDNVAVWAQTARNSYYPQPGPDAFYSGNPEMVEHIGLLRDYYAFTWGDALFVVIDPYWHSTGGSATLFGGGEGGQGGRDLWDVTLGETQYQWFKHTLESSTAKYKFVFSHHVLGTGRGGIELAEYYEWGGKDRSGKDSFAAKRPGWEKPIHQVMVDTQVSIFFQGHDHIFARQELDGVIYQTLPEPGNPNYNYANQSAYLSGDIYPNSGHVQVTVSPAGVHVAYIRSYLDRPDELAFSYTIE